MSEIMDFVSYHLKQVGLDSRSLNGGIILTGGGSQLKHVLQLTEYLTGLNARIGYPNEHIIGEHLDELSKPMYSTCIGLILKGYNDYENKMRAKGFEMETIEAVEETVTQPEAETVIENEEELETPVEPKFIKVKVEQGPVKVEGRTKSLSKFMDSFKEGIIDLFREEADKEL
jgi:cell division protein FtsA